MSEHLTKWVVAPTLTVVGWIGAMLFLHNKRIMDLLGTVARTEQKLDQHIAEEDHKQEEILENVKSMKGTISGIQRRIDNLLLAKGNK